MKGKIYIINHKSMIGKVIFDDDKESGILQFPKSFENGDIVYIEFQNNNIEQKATKLIAYSEQYFGFVMKKFNDHRGNILTTYPKMIGLVYFNNLNIPTQYNSKVSFRLKKTVDGKIEAIDIKEVDKKDIFKTQQPQFGKIECAITNIKDSFISEIIKTTKSKNMLSGKIKNLKDDRGFGFISTENSGDVFFRISQYEQFYKDSPSRNNIVNFIVNKSSKGLKVVRFCKEEEYLPTDKQYGFIDKKRFFLDDYKKFYNKDPEIGDIVYFYEERGKIKFKSDLESIKSTIFKKPTDSNRDKNIINSGKIMNLKTFYGFIKGKKQNIFFLKKAFKDFYKRDPKVGDNVNFTVDKTPKGLQVNKFLNLQADRIRVSSQSFKNFVNIEPNNLYYAYIQNNHTQEIYKYNPLDLSQSISCYKDRNISEEFKLLAIECLIENNFKDKKISQNKLKEDRKTILNNLIDKSIKNSNLQKALYIETILQKIDFDPHRLKRISTLTQEKYNFNIQSKNRPIKVKNTQQTKIILDTKENIQKIKHEGYLDVSFDKYKFKKAPLTTENWSIDLNHYELKNALFEGKLKIDI